jgi:glycine oxidase
MANHPDVLILGGGVIGLTTAHYLARKGVVVEVLDKGDFGQESSWAGAGIIGSTPPYGRGRTPWEQFCSLSGSLWPELARDLRESTFLDDGYVCRGGIHLLDAAEEAILVRQWQEAQLGCVELPPPQLHKVEPHLKPGPRKAYLFPRTAQVRNPRHVKALLASCRLQGVGLRSGCPVFGFERQGSRITAVRTAAEPLHAERYLITAGAWSDTLLEPLGFKPGIHPVRGQIALLNTGAPLLTHVIEEGSRYLVPRPDGRVLIGSTEENAGFDKHTTAGAIRELLAFAFELVPALTDAHLERCWAGLRPGSPDGLPFLGAVPGLDNLFIAAGHFRAGIHLSPATGWIMTELLTGQPPSVPLETFRLDR